MPSSAKRRSKVAKKVAAKKKLSMGSFIPNPLKDTAVEVILPAVGAYAASKFIQRIVYSQVSKRWPKYAQHAPVIAGALEIVASYYATKKVKQLAKYQTPILIGTSIAFVQSAIQAYLPKYGWIISDVKPEDYAPKQIAAPRPVAQLPPATAGYDILGLDEDEGMDMTPSIAGLGYHSPAEVTDPVSVASAAQMLGGDEGDFDLGSLGGDDGDGLGSLGGGDEG